MNGHGAVRVAALALSLGLHALLLWQGGGSVSMHAREVRADMTPVRLRIMGPQAAQSTPGPRPQHETARRSIARRAVKAARAARKKARDFAEPRPKAIAAQPSSSSSARSSARPSSGANRPRALRHGSLARWRQRYLAMLVQRIEAHKRYPRAARRRGIEGDVCVCFRLRSDGDVDELTARGGHRLLRQAALSAVRRATPLPPPPAGLRIREALRLTIRFVLR